jgi:aminoglycoside phosphotransferase (APT) family kinase protein
MTNAPSHLKQHTEPAILDSTQEAVTVTSADLDAILKRAGLHYTSADVTPLASSGVANVLYAIGADYILRISRDHPDAISDAHTESVAVPAVTAQHIKTPHLVTFDDSGDILPVPYTMYERVRGKSLLETPGDHATLASVYREFGAEIARLHQRVLDCPDPHNFLDKPYRIDALKLVDDLTTAGYLSTDNHVWLHTVFNRLHPAVQEATGFRRFLHDDAHPGNVMVDNGGFAALLDWGDAGWGDPTMEFVYIPSRAVPTALEGYRSVMPLDGDDTAEARILWDHLARALSRLKREPAPSKPAWSDRPGSPLVELLAAAGSIEAWQQYLR